MRRSTACILATSLAAFALPATAGAASADLAQSKVVSANPVNNTPHVLDGTVRAITVVGDFVVVGGNFEQVREAGSGKKALKRHNLFAYEMKTGKISTTFVPKVDGTVHALQPGSGAWVYIAGTFTNVNGKKTGTVTALKITTNQVHTGFKPNVNYRVTTMVRRGARLYIGGTFTKAGGKARTAVARLDSLTGVADNGFNFSVTTPRSGALKVYKLAVDPADTRMVINGTFTRVNGQSRPQIAMINLGKGAAKLSTWATTEYADACNLNAFDTYMRGMDFSPDGKYFVAVTTGGPYGTSTLCDTAARWEASRTGSGQKPTWVNHTGGDTLLSTSITGVAVYVGGHQRWLDNPRGRDNPGPGSVSRPGIGALNPSTGKALAWNPTRTLGHGVEALVAHPKGLLVGSDTDQLGKEYHGRIGMFPAG
ncbi:beta-propeller uncharacterized protein DUF5122 [Actinomadura pelletieri DSM 43383]|uniref:Beta-propeller uncharacterized protein DUF5122 n=1 Tax=Actinomadura pelletieri DSM 43383 TaxID=1120940 RepID=A0A495QIR9_9ACTN|nr:hypothetical protein [Actinomadura pelletieri]RKS72065.1 beta-propeller uncharacterized protein DUF5122 [Actinomadura pelletieri DSM 43383]